MTSKICVLLAAYNGEKYIESQLESILNQQNAELDIYISLDLSTDNTLEIIDKYKETHPNIILLEYGKRFGSSGQNFFHLLQSVDFSGYNYIAFADQDDIWLPEKFSTAIQSIKQHNVDGYSGNVTAFWPNGKKQLIKKDSPQVEFDYLFESAGPGCTFVMTRALAFAIQQLLTQKPEGIANLWLHDWFCYSFARSKGYKWFIDASPYVLYRQHDNNQIGARKGIRAFLYRIKTILSGDGFDKVLKQADYLEQCEYPVQLINLKNAISFIKLAFIGKKCRRRNNEKMYFTFAVIILILKRQKLYP